jgi:hypothetical protein
VLNAHQSDAGLYSVRVANALGSIVSAQARLKVDALVVAQCVDVIVSARAYCQAYASVDNGSFDPTGAPVTLTQIPAGPYPLGTNNVTLLVTGSRGGSASGTARVIVLDDTPPVISPTADIIISNDLNQCGAIVEFPQPTATDTCSPVASITCTPASGSFFPVGTTTVQCVASDAAGNESTASFAVTVYDLQPPCIFCPADIVVTNAHNAAASVVTYSPGANDNCPGLNPPVCNPPSGSAFAPGIHTVRCSVTDAAGGLAWCSFHVTVWPGNQPPVPAIEISPLLQLPGYTNLTVVAGNGTNATVTFDGSQSSDPDDAVFTYAWFNGPDLCSTDKVAAITLALGLHTITLSLDDTFPGGTSYMSVQVEVTSPAQATALLAPLVETSGLSLNTQRPLLASLGSVIDSAARGNLIASVNQIKAFENKVQAQVGRSNPALADALIQAAQQVIDALSPCARPMR